MILIIELFILFVNVIVGIAIDKVLVICEDIKNHLQIDKDLWGDK